MVKILKRFSAKTQDDTIKFADELSQLLKPNDVVLLQGNLGSGKTFLVKAFCQIVKTSDPAASPSFALIHHYQGPQPVNHFDFYRLHSEQELDQLGWEELLHMGAITFIEWPQLVEKHLHDYYKIEIEIKDDVRLFTLKKIETE